MSAVHRNLDTEESRAFWAAIDATVRAVESWPRWRQVFVIAEGTEEEGSDGK